jgi:hypothetical protein
MSMRDQIRVLHDTQGNPIRSFKVETTRSMIRVRFRVIDDDSKVTTPTTGGELFWDAIDTTSRVSSEWILVG